MKHRLASLFDGSGGFPLAGIMHGIEPVWASEIEAYPVAVTTARFPNMKHLGDITKIDGALVDRVDIITFGSPCQDLSVAGKQAGIESGERSILFFEAVRIIQEMREKTNGLYPTFAVWENVPGAYSSHKGNDFRLVLEALARVSEPEVSIPQPEKWQKSGEIVGDGWSVAWRTLDAQFLGVPQRRKRIYLVADFSGERAGKILFERESVCGDTTPSGEAREGTAADAERSVGGSCGAFCAGASPLARSIGWSEDVSPTLKSASAGLSMHAVCYALQGNGIDRADTAGCNGAGWREGECYTLNTIDRPAVVYPLNTQIITRSEKLGRGTGFGAGDNGDPAYTLQEAHGHAVCYAVQTAQANKNGLGARAGEAHTLNCANDQAVRYSADCRNLCLYENHGQDSRIAECADTAPTVAAKYGTGGNNTPIVLSCGNGQLHQIPMSDKANTLDCMHDQQIVLHQAKPPRKYIVRRLMPVECARLQGFPDWWGDVPFKGKPHSDSAEYKMWGNGIALPCAEFVLGRIAEVENAEP